MNEVFARLAGSRFRRRFRLGDDELAYLRSRGMDTVLAHARDMIGRRLAPAHPPRDGSQTPMRGHPVFIAQHATGTCCRGCLQKWHGLEKGRALGDEQQDYVVRVLERWLRMQEEAAPPPPPPPQLGLDLG